MSNFASLPAESIVHILLFLSPNRIRRSQLICRLILDVVKESNYLQYLLQLDSLGFSVPLNPQSDLSYNEKVSVLRGLLTPSNSLSHTPTQLDLGTAEPLVSNCQFSRGVFARGKPTLDVTQRLELYRLPSRNTETKYHHWHHPDLDVNAHDFRIDPDLDLLVLLESDPSPGDQETDLQLRFHLRSLSAGVRHPLAAVPVITTNCKFTATFAPASFQIVGKYLAILCFTNPLLDPISPKISVWDWTTGDLVTFAEVPGRHFAFVSDTTFIVHYDRRKWLDTHIIGSLEVYTFDPSAPPSRARHVASLHLPETTEGPCHSTSSFVFTPPAPSPLVIHGSTQITTPARLYEFSTDTHFICFKIRAFNIKSYPSEMANGTLFIPASTILDAISSIIASGSARAHIPWEDWAHGVSWLNNRASHAQKDYIFGQRAAFVRYNAKIQAWEIPVYDLGPSARPGMEDPWDALPRKRAGADSYLDNVFKEDKCGARSPRLTALITIPREVVTGDVRAIDNPPEVMIDDEHVVIFKSGSPNDGCNLYMYTL